MEDGTKLAFCDGRRFGKVRLVDDVLGSADVSKLGWDALLAPPAFDELKAQLARFAKRSISIKALLLDQVGCANEAFGGRGWCVGAGLLHAAHSGSCWCD
jgi:formamidopyrimidine-DNA glycosylase